MTKHTAGDKLRDRRLAADLTIDEAWADLRAMLPRRYVPSSSKLQRMETEIPEDKWDGIVIVALSHIYKCRISDLSTQVASEYDEVGDLLASSSPWIATPIPGQLPLLAA
jgi:hypothetical protein